MFYGKIDKELTADLLNPCPVGTFLVRESQTKANFIVIVAKEEDGELKNYMYENPYSDISTLISYINETLQTLEHLDQKFVMHLFNFIFLQVPQTLYLDSSNSHEKEPYVLLKSYPNNEALVINKNFELINMDMNNLKPLDKQSNLKSAKPPKESVLCCKIFY